MNDKQTEGLMDNAAAIFFPLEDINKISNGVKFFFALFFSRLRKCIFFQKLAPSSGFRIGHVTGPKHLQRHGYFYTAMGPVK